MNFGSNYLLKLTSKIYSVLSSPFASFYWSRRNIAEGYWNNIDLPAQKYVLGFIKELTPQSIILEAGSGSGCHLALLARALPTSFIYGIDINHKSVSYGNEKLSQMSITNAHISVGNITQHITLPDKYADIVFTDAVLTHIPDSDIDHTVIELFRLSKKWVVMIEPQLYDGQQTKLLRYYNFQWLRDYISIINKLKLGKVVRVIKIPVELWAGEPWKSLGNIIIVEKNETQVV